MEELKEEKMYCLVAPDGSTQLSTLAPDYPMCLAMVRMLHQAGIGQNSKKLLEAGFKILPVKVTITQDGDENEAFNRAKDDLEDTDSRNRLKAIQSKGPRSHWPVRADENDI